MKNLTVSVPAWMIEDGSHQPVEVGQIRKLAIEVFSTDALAVPNRCPCLIHNEGNSYKGCAQVWKSVDKRLMFFDFGSITAVKKVWKHGTGFFKGTWNISLDGYFSKNIEEINYEWVVLGIELNTSPLIIEDENEIIRDSSRLSSVMLEKIDLVEDVKKLNIIGDPSLLSMGHYLNQYLKYQLHLTRKVSHVLRIN